MLVSQDLAALGGNTQLLFQIQPLDVGAAAGGQEHAVARDGVQTRRVLIGDAAGFDLLDARVQIELHAELFIGLHEDVANFGVGRTCDLGHHFDHDDLHADGGKIARHFQTDDAAADAHERLGHFAQVEDLAVRHHKAGGEPLLHARNGRDGRDRAGGNDEVLTSDGRTACIHLKQPRGVLAEDLGGGGVDLDLVGLHREADAGDERFDDLVLAVDDRRVVKRDVLRVHAVIRAVLRGGVLLGAIQKALGGDAALVQARSAQRPLFHDCRRQTALRRAFGAQIAARAAAQDHDIKSIHVCSSSRKLS